MRRTLLDMVESRFEQSAKHFTVKMRSKVHAQSYDNVVAAQQSRRLSPAGLLAMERLSELTALQQRHQRTFDPALRDSATQILRTFPLFSIDEDPHFVHAQKALRLAAYFGAVDLPVTYALINQHTKNAFLLDAFAMASFLYTLPKLKHPQSVEIIGILLPRLREVAPELLAHEAIHILRLLRKHHLDDLQFAQTVTATLTATAEDVPLISIRQGAIVLSETFPEEAQRVLLAAEHRLCDEIETNTDVLEVKAVILDVCHVLSNTCKSSRRMLNSVARRSMDLAQQLTPLDSALVLKSFFVSSYRHLRLLRVLSSSIAGRIVAGEPTKDHGLAASITVQALSHFYVEGCEEVVVSLVKTTVSVLEGYNLALTLLACARLQCVFPRVAPATDTLCTGAPLLRYARNAHSLPVTSRILCAMAQLGRYESDDDISIVLSLLSLWDASRGRSQVTAGSSCWTQSQRLSPTAGAVTQS
uniref:Uncharacterized protein TCIL3000_11_16800 n=1 Tax=Trypanosoma congolense (strain IL3000) TaxID=1068625 RepID=G0V3E3_TRYCI|nr:unnamed protein product [Trypanosoma congolense IL3000]